MSEGQDETSPRDDNGGEQQNDLGDQKKQVKPKGIKGNVGMTKDLQRAPTEVEGSGGVKTALTQEALHEFKSKKDDERANAATADKASHKNAIMQDPDAVLEEGRVTPDDKKQEGESSGLENEDEEFEDDYEDEDENEIAARIRSKKNCFYRSVYLFVTHPVYNFIVFVLILVNTVVLAVDDFPQTIAKENILAVFNDFFTWAFFAEMIMKMIGLGVKNYVRDSFNLFDAIVVLLSLVDVAITSVLS